MPPANGSRVYSDISRGRRPAPNRPGEGGDDPATTKPGGTGSRVNPARRGSARPCAAGPPGHDCRIDNVPAARWVGPTALLCQAAELIVTPAPTRALEIVDERERRPVRRSGRGAPEPTHRLARPAHRPKGPVLPLLARGGYRDAHASHALAVSQYVFGNPCYGGAHGLRPGARARRLSISPTIAHFTNASCVSGSRS